MGAGECTGECTEWRTRTGTCEGIGVGMSAREGEQVRVWVGLDNAEGFDKRGRGDDSAR